MAPKKHRFLQFLFICLSLVLIVLIVQNYRIINTAISGFDFSTLFLRFPGINRLAIRIYPAGNDTYLFYTRSNQLGLAGIKNRTAWNVYWNVVPGNTIIQDAAFRDNLIIVDGKKISAPDNTGFFLYYNLKGKETARFTKEAAISHITIRILAAAEKKIIVAGYEYPRTYKSGLYAGLYTREGKVLKELVLPATANLVLGKTLLTAKGECILVCLENKLFRPVSLVKIIKLDAELNVLFNQGTTRELDNITSVTEEKDNTIIITGSRKTGAQSTAAVFTIDFSRKNWYL